MSWSLRYNDKDQSDLEVDYCKGKVSVYLDKKDRYNDEQYFSVDLEPLVAIEFARAIFEHATAILELEEMTL